MARFNRWVVLGVALLIESVGGLFYMFGVFSQTLKVHHWSGGAGANSTLTQGQLDMIATVANLGGNIGIHVGFVYDAFGVAPVIVFATLCGVCGWVGMWASLTGAIATPYWGLLCFSFLQGHAQMGTDVGMVPTIARKFPQQRGMAMGLAKSFVGLSGALATQVYVGFFEPKIEHFMLFVAIEILCIGCVGLVFVNSEDFPAQGEPAETPAQAAAAAKRLGRGFVLAFALVGEILASSLLYAFMPAETKATKMGLAVAMVVIFGSLIVYVAFGSDDGAEGKANASINYSSEVQPLVEEGGAQKKAVLKDYTVFQAMAGVDFWLQFVAFLIGGGSGLVVINNIAQMNLALGGAPRLKNVFVTIISVSNCAGRLASGAISDKFLHDYGTPRPFFFGVVVAMMSLAHLVLYLTPSPAVLYMASVVGGSTYGAMNALNPICSSEIYGNKHFGAIYTTLSLSLAIGSYLVAKLLAGDLYDDQHGGTTPGSTTCHGIQCYRRTELICAALCAFGAACLFLLSHRSKARYSAMYPLKKSR